jgi:SAM-dependent methyltransferase
MSQPLSQRLNYHPDPRELSISDRKVGARLDLIASKVDFRDKTVLDLGCSGGIFSFSIARVARNVIAVDGDYDVIQRNVAIQRELGLTNIEFIHSSIDKDLIASLGKVDTTLFLSVYHHMLSISDAYDWNANFSATAASELIDSININTDSLVFEIGYPNEGYEWCERLPDYGLDWDDYVRQCIFRARYRHVEALLPQNGVGYLNAILTSRLSTAYKADSWLLQKIKTFMQFDSRDFRKIYFGFK